MQDVNTILIIANRSKRGASQLMRDISAYLRSIHKEVQVYGYTGIPAEKKFANYDLAISIGGDGTALYVCRALAPLGTPILPLNFGNFGFITEISHHEWREELETIITQGMEIEERVMAEAVVWRKKRAHVTFLVLNEAVIATAGISKLARFIVYVGNEPLGEFGADGLIVATATGSTAYSVAAGGPILHPELRGLIVNPICPFTLSSRPLVIPESQSVAVQLLDQFSTPIVLTADGQQHVQLQPHDKIVVKISRHSARIVRTQHRTFYEVLSSKLGWSGHAHA